MNKILVVVSPDMERYRKGWKKCWHVWFLTDGLGESLRALEKELLTIEEAFLLLECDQIIDPDTRLRYPTGIAINKLTEVIMPESMYQYRRVREYLNQQGVDTGRNAEQ
jgi:hypothetical protein